MSHLGDENELSFKKFCEVDPRAENHRHGIYQIIVYITSHNYAKAGKNIEKKN